MISSTLKFGRLSALTTFLSSLALGCVITLGENGKTAEECPDDNSTLSDGKCYCKAFYDWCHPDDLNDLTCCEDTTTSNSNSNSNGTTSNGSNTATDSGTTQDPTGGTTVDVPTTSDSQGTTGAPIDCSVTTDPPASCDEANENFLCIAADNAACDVEGSKYYVCQGGVWVENTTDGDASCKSDGYDFSFGCKDNGTSVDFICGTGPGSACTTGEANSCSTETVLDSCVLGKLSATDCTAYCMEVGDDMGVTYDYGYCGDQRGITCICCDEGDEGCPINTGGTSTSAGSSTGGGSSTGA